MTTQSNTTRNHDRQQKVKVNDLAPKMDPTGGLLLPAVQQAREAAATSGGNLRNISLATHSIGT
jgi:hypothetical protein